GPGARSRLTSSWPAMRRRADPVSRREGAVRAGAWLPAPAAEVAGTFLCRRPVVERSLGPSLDQRHRQRIGVPLTLAGAKATDNAEDDTDEGDHEQRQEHR